MSAGANEGQLALHDIVKRCDRTLYWTTSYQSPHIFLILRNFSQLSHSLFFIKWGPLFYCFSDSLSTTYSTQNFENSLSFTKWKRKKLFLLGYFTFLLLVSRRYVAQAGVLRLKWTAIPVMLTSGASDHKQQDCAVVRNIARCWESVIKWTQLGSLRGVRALLQYEPVQAL